MSTLRNIAVVVVEPEAGRFFWQLREASSPVEDGWRLLGQGVFSRARWLDAFKDGVDEVMVLTHRSATGPRR